MADTATFQNMTSATITTANIANVSYSATDPSLTASFIEVQGDAGLSYDSNAFSFSFNSTGMSLAMAPISGFGSNDPLGNSFVSLNYGSTLTIANGNADSVTVPLTVSLMYSMNATGKGSTETAFTASSLLISEILLQSDPLLIQGWLCDDSDCQAASNSMQSEGPRPGMMNGTITDTLDISIPANSSYALSVVLASGGNVETAPPTPAPEPGALALVGTGLLGFFGAVKKRLAASDI
jgi:hypothetical protein